MDPKELAALIARALPSGASPTAEIMRDASTGIDRGFGYVSVPAGEGVKAGAERAIAAYNGSRYGSWCWWYCCYREAGRIPGWRSLLRRQHSDSCRIELISLDNRSVVYSPFGVPFAFAGSFLLLIL